MSVMSIFAYLFNLFVKLPLREVLNNSLIDLTWSDPSLFLGTFIIVTSSGDAGFYIEAIKKMVEPGEIYSFFPNQKFV